MLSYFSNFRIKFFGGARRVDHRRAERAKPPAVARGGPAAPPERESPDDAARRLPNAIPIPIPSPRPPPAAASSGSSGYCAFWIERIESVRGLSPTAAAAAVRDAIRAAPPPHRPPEDDARLFAAAGGRALPYGDVAAWLRLRDAAPDAPRTLDPAVARFWRDRLGPPPRPSGADAADWSSRCRATALEAARVGREFGPGHRRRARGASRRRAGVFALCRVPRSPDPLHRSDPAAAAEPIPQPSAPARWPEQVADDPRPAAPRRSPATVPARPPSARRSPPASVPVSVPVSAGVGFALGGLVGGVVGGFKAGIAGLSKFRSRSSAADQPSSRRVPVARRRPRTPPRGGGRRARISGLRRRGATVERPSPARFVLAGS